MKSGNIDTNLIDNSIWPCKVSLPQRVRKDIQEMQLLTSSSDDDVDDDDDVESSTTHSPLWSPLPHKNNEDDSFDHSLTTDFEISPMPHTMKPSNSSNVSKLTSFSPSFINSPHINSSTNQTFIHSPTIYPSFINSPTINLSYLNSSTLKPIIGPDLNFENIKKSETIRKPTNFMKTENTLNTENIMKSSKIDTKSILVNLNFPCNISKPQRVMRKIIEGDIKPEKNKLEDYKKPEVIDSNWIFPKSKPQRVTMKVQEMQRKQLIKSFDDVKTEISPTTDIPSSTPLLHHNNEDDFPNQESTNNFENVSMSQNVLRKSVMEDVTIDADSEIMKPENLIKSVNNDTRLGNLNLSYNLSMHVAKKIVQDDKIIDRVFKPSNIIKAENKDTNAIFANMNLSGKVSMPQRVSRDVQEMQLKQLMESFDDDDVDDVETEISPTTDIPSSPPSPHNNNEDDLLKQPLTTDFEISPMPHTMKPSNSSNATTLTSFTPSFINSPHINSSTNQTFLNSPHINSFKNQAFINSPTTFTSFSNSHTSNPSRINSHSLNLSFINSPTLKHSSRTQSSFDSLLSLSPPSTITQPSSSESFSPSTTTDNFGGVQLMIKGITYNIIEEIGKGGFSVVYRASSKGLKECAIKCIHLQNADPSTIDAYFNEVAILKKLKGSLHVIYLYDDCYYKSSSKMYLVMEKGEEDFRSFFEARSTSDAVAQLVLVKKCWTDMLQAVHVIHHNDIVHWDLKPANFVVMGGRLKVIDFGISKQVLPDQTSATCDQIMGTYNYMSPEAFTNLETDLSSNEVRVKAHKKSDIWSLGCILYSMVYSGTPFQKFKDPIKKMTAIISASYNISFLPTPLGTDVVNTMKKCLERDSKLRPSVEDLLCDDPLLKIQFNKSITKR